MLLNSREQDPTRASSRARVEIECARESLNPRHAGPGETTRRGITPISAVIAIICGADPTAASP